MSQRSASTPGSPGAQPGRRQFARPAIVLGLLVIVLGGCSIKPIRQEVAEELRSTKDVTERARAQLEEEGRTGPVLRIRGAKLAGDEVEVAAARDLPEVFGRRFTFVSADQSLATVVDELSSRAGVPIRFVNVAGVDAPSSGDNGAAGAAAGAAAPFDVDYSGTLKGLLDTIAQRIRAHWRYVDGGVEIFEVETRSFTIFLSPGARQVKSSIALSGAGGGAGASGSAAPAGTVSVDSTQTVDVYAALVASVEALIEERADAPAGQAGAAGKSAGKADAAGGQGSALSGAGGGTSVLGKARVVASPALGMLTVTAPPPAMARVASYIKSINERFSANVRIDVRIYSLSLKRDANAGFSADLVYEKLGRYGLAVTGQGLLQPAGGIASSLTLGVTDPGSRFRSSELLVRALAEYGDVAVVTSGQVIAPNGQPSPLQIADEVTYLASVSTTQTPNVGTTTTLVPASRVVGFTANFLPLLLDDDRILLQYQLNLSQLASLNQITSGSASIQTPSVRQQSLQQQAFVRHGQTIVLFGFESSRAENTKNEGLTGASANASHARQVTIITMQVQGGRNGSI